MTERPGESNRAPATRRGVACCLGILLLVFGGLAVIGFLLARSCRPGPAAPGQAALSEATSHILLEGQAVAFGNTEDARARAERFARVMASMREIAFTKANGGLSDVMAGDKFLTHCEVRGDRVCFLVHVPELHRFTPEARQSLLKIAWMAARRVTEDLRKDEDRRLAVAFHGRLLYGSAVTGMGNGTPSMIMDDVDERVLYPFFIDAPPSARPASPTVEARPQ